MLQKLIHKKWMTLSLAIGNILLIAIASAFPMFRSASLTRMLRDEFATYEESRNTDSAVISITGKLRKKGNSDGYEFARKTSETFFDDMDIPGQILLRYDYLQPTSATPAVMRENSIKDGRYSVGTLRDLEANSEVISGRMYSDGLIGDDTIEAVITTGGFVSMELLVGEEVDFNYLKLPNGKLLKVVVVGVITNADDTAKYWQKLPESYDSEFFISEKLYDELFMQEGSAYERNTVWYMGFDYSALTYRQVDTLLDHTTDVLGGSTEYGTVERPAYLRFLENFLINEKKIEATLIILQIPVLFLLCAFIYMISGQMYNMEQNEISLLMSRGAGKGQVFSIYLMQALFMAVTGVVFGLPLGSFLCRAIGSASAFLEFGSRRALEVEMGIDVLIYVLAAMLLSILMSVIPSLVGNRGSIVNTKAKRARNRAPLWQKLFLDVILLGISIYGYYNFNRQKNILEAQVLQGESLDPLLYLSSSFFILGAALIMLRVIPIIVKLIFKIGEKKWGPALFASYTEIIRSFRGQFFIMTFLILTASLGIFNTTVARTIADNNERNLRYTVGTDIVLAESWPNNKFVVAANPDIPLVYTEPDFSKYGMAEGVEKAARVFVDDNATCKRNIVKVMGINTKEFGLATSLPDGLTDRHYYDYLNGMSTDTEYVLVSSSFRDIEGYSEGDRIVYKVSGTEVSGIIAGFVDYFPGFVQEKTLYNADGTVYSEPQYLIVAHLDHLQQNVGIRPYQVWIKLKEGATAESVYDLIENNKIKLTLFTDLLAEIEKIKSDTLFQGTNGILTLSFMVILVLCFIGYLIYWTLTISSRELMLGVLRAMGMSRNEVFGMLINEQLFSAILPLAAGAGIGLLSSKLFVPLIQIAYSASDQALPLKLITLPGDMIRMFVIIMIMILLCFIVLARQIASLKIAQALKLGED